MATKWADFCITAVRYDARHEHIVAVRARADNGSTLEAEKEYTRQTVAEAIDRGTTYITVYEKAGQWTHGARVEVIVVERVKYLRTDSNRTKFDNLGELPEF